MYLQRHLQQHPPLAHLMVLRSTQPQSKSGCKKKRSNLYTCLLSTLYIPFSRPNALTGVFVLRLGFDVCLLAPLSEKNSYDASSLLNSCLKRDTYFTMPYDPTRSGECTGPPSIFISYTQTGYSFLWLLAAEQAEDEAVLKERLSSWSPARLKEEGYCLTGLSAFWLQANQFGRPVAAFLLGPGQALPEHRFEYGPIFSLYLNSCFTPFRIEMEHKSSSHVLTHCRKTL